MKKTLVFIVLIILCCKTKQNSKSDAPVYFFFNAQHEDMIKRVSDSRDKTKFLFFLSKRNAVFTSFKPKQEIFAKDTINVNIKNIDWLKGLSITQFDSLFYKKPMNDNIYVIEKDLSNNRLYKYEVLRSQEID